jgi:hypothetical protein
MNLYGVMEELLHSFLNSELDESEWFLEAGVHLITVIYIRVRQEI